MKITIEGFTIRIEADTEIDKKDLERIAKGKIHYYPETNTIIIF